MNALAHLPPDIARRRVLPTKESAAFLGMSVSTFQRMRLKGAIPAPIQLSERRLGWRIGDLCDWQDAHVAPAGNDNNRP